MSDPRLSLPLVNSEGKTIPPGKVEYRHTILGAMFRGQDEQHPDISEHAIVVQYAPGEEVLPKVNGKEIDFWGSSLKKGRVIYTTPGMDIGGRFVDTAEQVNYASILLSSLRSKPVQIEATVLVVEDGEMGTGDCSGFARPIILQTCLEHDRKQQLDRQASGLVPSLPAQECEVAQFRMALEDCQLVKGVIQPGETGDADFVLPLSCFKGRQPETGLQDVGVVPNRLSGRRDIDVGARAEEQMRVEAHRRLDPCLGAHANDGQSVESGLDGGVVGFEAQ